MVGIEALTTDFAPDLPEFSLELRKQVETMRSAGLEDPQIARLVNVKAGFISEFVGEIEDLTLDHIRIGYVEFLLDSARIKP